MRSRADPFLGVEQGRAIKVCQEKLLELCKQVKTYVRYKVPPKSNQFVIILLGGL
jgi:hypothetical protein